MRTLLNLLIAGCLCSFVVSNALGQANYLTPYGITTIAGTPGVSGSADGTNGAASFDIQAVNLCGVAVDTNGNVYVSDTGNSTIRKLTPLGTNWVVSTIAGIAGATGAANGTNTAATFNYPDGLAMDTNGNIYVLDALNSLIREISPDGTNWVTSTISTLPNDSVSWGIACDKAGNVYTVTSTGIQEISPTNNWQPVSIAANLTFDSLRGITVDANGNLYVVDDLDRDVQKVWYSGNCWTNTIIAGTSGVSGYADGTNSSAAFNLPESIASDNQGNLYVTDSGNGTIRKIAPVGARWVVSTVAGISGGSGTTNGVGINARFNYPAGLALDGSGNIYVGDTANNTIRMGSAAKLPLTMTPSGPDADVISWPGAASYVISGGTATATNWLGYGNSGPFLQSSGNMEDWVNYAGGVASADGTNSTTISSATGNVFFRLIQ